MLRVLVSLSAVFLLTGPSDGMARRVHLSSEQTLQLAHIRIILLTSNVMTEKGPIQSEALNTLVAKRFQELGFSVVNESTASHDVEFRVFCEERKRFPGITPSGGDAELEEAPDRLWHGPACRFRYRLNGEDLGWSTEVRAPSSDEKSEIRESGELFEQSAVFAALLQEVARSDFPLLVMADWGHASRLASLLLDPKTQPAQQQLIVQELAGFSSSTFLPVLLTLIQRPHFPVEAVEALASAGEEGLPHLMALFQDRTQTQSIRAAAARGIGRIEGSTGNPAAFEPMLGYLAAAVQTITSPDDIEFPVLTAVVWSLGKSHSDRVLRLLELLQAKIYIFYDTSENMQALREAVSVVAKSLEHVQI
ncbi:MAG: HEAT repeat domain-containing protein [Nitrospirales bacterium]